MTGNSNDLGQQEDTFSLGNNNSNYLLARLLKCVLHLDDAVEMVGAGVM